MGASLISGNLRGPLGTSRSLGDLGTAWGSMGVVGDQGILRIQGKPGEPCESWEAISRSQENLANLGKPDEAQRSWEPGEHVVPWWNLKNLWEHGGACSVLRNLGYLKTQGRGGTWVISGELAQPGSVVWNKNQGARKQGVSTSDTRLVLMRRKTTVWCVVLQFGSTSC